MKRNLLLFAMFAITILSLSVQLWNTVSASPPLEPRTQAATNSATIDITVNDAGNLSVGGVNLSGLGVAALDTEMSNLAKSLGSVHVISQAQRATLDIQGTQVAKIDWSPASLKTALTLATRYGVPLQPAVQARIEEWLSTSTLDLTARFANEVSKPLMLSLSKVLLVDVQPSGQVLVETIPVGATLDATTLQTIQRAGNQATLCWNKGTLTAKVDGQDLPSLRLNPEGATLLTQAANLPVDSNATSAILLGSRLGVDISLPGGTHATDAICSE
jgi:hypothetical protein